MKNSFYFPHDVDASTNKDIVKLRAKFGWEGYGIYWAIIEALAREDGYIDRGVIGVAIGAPNSPPIIDYLLEIGLLEENEKGVYSKRLLKNIEIRKKYIKAGKKGAKQRWGNTSVKNSPPIKGANRVAIAPLMQRKGKEIYNNNININKKRISILCLTKYQKQTLQKNFPYLDINLELRKANVYLKAEGIKKNDYLAWFRNWLRNCKKGKEKENPIIKDLDFKRLRNCNTSTNAGQRSFLAISELLDKRYPSFKFKKEWIEAKKLLKFN